MDDQIKSLEKSERIIEKGIQNTSNRYDHDYVHFYGDHFEDNYALIDLQTEYEYLHVTRAIIESSGVSKSIRPNGYIERLLAFGDQMEQICRMHLNKTSHVQPLPTYPEIILFQSVIFLFIFVNSYSRKVLVAQFTHQKKSICNS